MSNVLLVDTNFSSRPIYHFLKKAGHKVTVVGGNPKDALAKSADDYVNLDYSDVDQTRRLIEERNIEFLVPGCNDRSYMVCAEINADGRFPGIDPFATAEVINNKEKFRAFSFKFGLPTPRVLEQDEIGSRWPVIVKPVDAFSGRGVTIIRDNNKTSLANAISIAKNESILGACLVEDFVEGQLYSHTAFIQSGDIIVDHIVEEHSTTNPFVVDTSRVVYNFLDSMLLSIRENIRLLASELNLHDGLIHTQFISNGTQYWLIEITRRCPGDLYSQLIELSTGYNYAENYVRPFVGLPFDAKKPLIQNWIMRHTVTVNSACSFDHLHFHNPVWIERWISLSVTGDLLKPSPASRIGIVFCKTSDQTEFKQLYETTFSRQLYDVIS